MMLVVIVLYIINLHHTLSVPTWYVTRCFVYSYVNFLTLVNLIED